jgi:hypothetical protein
MDDSPAQVPRGGTVEPASRVSVTRAVARTLDEQMAARFELRDPFAEVTYRTKTFDEMVVKAEQLGAMRFSAIDEEGRRTPVLKVDGVWQRPQRDVEHGATEDRTQATPAPVAPAAPVVEATIARIDRDAERAAQLARLQVALNERYVIKRAVLTLGDKPIGQTEYRYRGDTSRVAFTESALKLTTDTNSPSVARSMVDVAQTRNWNAIRVSGHEDFRRLVWLEASVRNVKAIGYEPVPGDQELLRKERESRQVNRIEPGASMQGTSSTGKGSARGSGGRKTVLAALEAVLVAQRVPELRRAAILGAAEQQLTRRIANGEVHRIKVLDPSAPSRTKPALVRPDPERTRERPATAR